MRILALLLACLGLVSPLAAKADGALKVLGLEGGFRLLRFETEAWPLEAGQDLPDNSRIELDAGSKLRLRFKNYLDLSLAGPARLTVYVVPSPSRGEFEQDRVVLRLDEGTLLLDGRFQFGRPADLLLSLPDRSLALPKDSRFLVRVSQGHSEFWVPDAAAAGSAFALQVSGTALVKEEPVRAPAPGQELPPALLDEMRRPVKVFVIARDYNQDLGVWPKPAVLGPLLTERLSKLPGIQVTDGSGDTYFAYKAGTALKSGEDFFLRELALAQGARWLVAGNGIAMTPMQDETPNSRRVRGEAEVRLLEADREGLELVSESGDTLVARAGRPLIQASRDAMEAAADEVAGHLAYHINNLLAGQAHAEVLIRVELENADNGGFKELRSRLGGLESVQRVFRRSFSKKLGSLDLMLRKNQADFDAEWSKVQGGKSGFAALPSRDGVRRLRQTRRTPQSRKAHDAAD